MVTNGTKGEHGCGLMGTILHCRRTLWRPQKSSVRLLPLSTTSNDGTTNPPPENSGEKKPAFVSPRSSVSQTNNHGLRSSDATRTGSSSSPSSQSSSLSRDSILTKATKVQEKQMAMVPSNGILRSASANILQPKLNGILRSSSGNVLLLGQLASLKQPETTGSRKNCKTRTPIKATEYSNATMGNILVRKPTDEIWVRGPLNKLDPEALKAMGNDKYKQGKFEEALLLYDQAIAIDANKAAYRSNKGAALIGLGRLLEAVSECREAIKIDPFYHRAHHRLATLYIRLGFPEKALHHFNHSGNMANLREIAQAKALETCLNRCIEAKQLKNWPTILIEIECALSIGIDFASQMHALQAEAYMDLHRHDKAQAAHKKIPNFNMDTYTAVFGKGSSTYLYLVQAQVHMTSGRFEDAISAAQHAVKLSPSDKEARAMVIRTQAVAAARSRGNNLFMESKFSEACSTYSEGLDQDPYNSILLCNRAACRSKLGQFEKAVEDCTLALSVQPSYSKARLRRAHCNAKMERWEASIQDYELLIREKPGNEEVGQALFEAQVQLKKQQGQDVRDLKFGSKLVQISSNKCFRHLVTSPGMSVVLFCNKTSQKKALELLEQICTRFPTINFLKVEVEDHPYLAKSEAVSSVPAFKIYKNGSRVKEIPGNNLHLLESQVILYSR